jgi:hypothetical protein
MNDIDIHAWLKRQQVLAVVLAGVCLILCILACPLSALKYNTATLERRIAAKSDELSKKNYLLGEKTLGEKRQEEQARNALLTDEWRRMVARVSVFPKSEEQASVGHIDFKVKLFDVRQRLLRKSRSLDIGLPGDLGVDDAIHSDEDARKKMLQLRTVEKLVNLALDLKIVTLRSIEPLPPVSHQTEQKVAFLEEYPVRMEFSGDIGNLYDLLNATIEPDSTLALKRVRIEPARGRSNLLNIEVVMSSLVFLKTPNEMPLALQVGTTRSRPLGD